VIERDVDEVVLPGTEGSLGVRPGHAPLLVGLAPGIRREQSPAVRSR